MAVKVLLKNASDAYVAEKNPDKNYSGSDRIYIANSAASENTRQGYIYFGIPSGLERATIISATMRLYNGGDNWEGSSTVRIYRLDESWKASKVTWNNKPETVGNEATETKNNPSGGTLWEFDVSEEIQQVANGAPWYGFRIASLNNKGWFHSSKADDNRRPQLQIVYTTEPFPPATLVPDNGQAVSTAKPILQWDFRDVAGDTSMAGFHLRLFSSLALANSNGAGDLLDTTLGASVPQLDLNTTAYAGLANTATLYWRVRVQDGAGLWSAWSDVAYFTRQDKGILTLTNPPASPAEVLDPTPVISWTFTGQTQKAFQVIIAKAATPERPLWLSGVIHSSATAISPPPGVIVEPGADYLVTLHVSDTQNRRSIPGDPNFVAISRPFTLSLSAATPPVTGFNVASDPYRPWMALNWTYATVPDTFVIFRDGLVVAEVEPSAVLVGGTTYQYIDRWASPRVLHTWAVAAKEEAIVSADNPSAVGLVRLVTTCVSALDGSREVFLFNPGVDASRAESSEVHHILGQAPPVLITQAIRGYEGSLSGVIAQDVVPGLSATQQLANLEYFKDNPGVPVRLSWVNKVLQVVLFNVTDSPVPYADGKVDHVASMNFFQTDF